MSIRLIKWFAFSILAGLLPLGIKFALLYLCEISIGYNDIYSEIVFFDLLLNVGVITEAISIKKHKVIQIILISAGTLTTIILAVIFGILTIISYGYKLGLDFKKMVIPTGVISITSIILSLGSQIFGEVER